jgi:sortase A
MRVETQAASSRGNHRALVWAERALVGAGAAMLIWVAALVVDSRVSQQLARDAMAALPPTTVASSASGRPVVIPLGAPIGELSIPRVKLSAMVLHGSDARTLRRGPGHIENTPLPGEQGNVAIAGHRDSFFRPIRDVRVGDDIFLDTGDGRFHYRVSSLGIVEPTDVSVLDPTDTATLTLITCYPFWLAGPAPDRFIVRATEVARPVTVPVIDVARVVTAADLSPAQAEAPHTMPDPSRTALPVRSSTASAAVLPGRDDARDEVLVRQAIERFRATYNARLARRPRGQDGVPLALRDCQVALRWEVATAMCADASPMSDREGVWIFTLRDTGTTWDIASVEPR